jgi:hypothetical protein
VRGSIYGGRGNDATEAGLGISGSATVHADMLRTQGDRRIETPVEILSHLRSRSLMNLGAPQCPIIVDMLKPCA